MVIIIIIKYLIAFSLDNVANYPKVSNIERTYSTSAEEIYSLLLTFLTKSSKVSVIKSNLFKT